MQFECKCELGSTGRRRRDSLAGVLWAVPMDLQPRQDVGGRGHARRGGELARGRGERRVRAVKELLVALGAAHVVARGDRAYWQSISVKRGPVRGDALIVYRKGLVLKRFCRVWMTGWQMEWNIWMGRSAHMGCGEVHTLTTTAILPRMV